MSENEQTPFYLKKTSHGGSPYVYFNQNVGGVWQTWVTDRWTGMGFVSEHERLTPAEMRELARALLYEADTAEAEEREKRDALPVKGAAYQVGDDVEPRLPGEQAVFTVTRVEERLTGDGFWYELCGPDGGTSYPWAESELRRPA